EIGEGTTEPIAVTGVTMANVSVTVGNSVTLSPIVTPNNAANKTVTFAIVNGGDKIELNTTNGSVMGKVAGTATVRVTTTDGNFTDDATVTVTAAPATISNEYCYDVAILGGLAENTGSHIGQMDKTGSYCEWAINGGAGGTATITVTYATNVDAPSFGIAINNGAVNNHSITSNGDWGAYTGSYQFTANLNAGNNTIRFTTPSGGVNLRCITVVAPAAETSCNMTISAQPQSANYSTGASASALTVTASGSGLSYVWYRSADNSNSTLANDTQVGTAATYTPNTATAGTSYYYVIITDGNDCTATSNVAAITVTAAPAQDCDKIRIVRFVRQNGDGNSTVKGTAYAQDNNGTIAVSTATDNTTAWYEIPTDKADEFYYKNVQTGRYLYRVRTDNPSGWNGEVAKAADTNAKTDFYKWKYVACETWGDRYYLGNVAGANFDNITSGNVYMLNTMLDFEEEGFYGQAYQANWAVGTNSNATHGSLSIQFDVVSNNADNPDCETSDCDITISAQPKSASYFVGDTAVPLTVTASGSDLSYLWYQSTDNSNSTPANDIQYQSANFAAFTPDISSAGTFYYYAVISNNDCSVTSNVATITVTTQGTSTPTYPAGYPKTMAMQNPLFWEFGSPQVNAAGALIPGSNGNLYTADASAHVWNINGVPTLYVYASHDMEQAAGCDRMDRYHVFSTTDMVNWTDYGEILKADDVPWHDGTFQNNSKFMWAPDAAYKNGKYYFYFPHPSKNEAGTGNTWGDSWKIGIAVSDHPASDFTILNQTLGGLPYKGEIDPCVFVDDDGQAYFYYGGGGTCYAAKLKDNMIELDGPLQEQQGLSNFHEGTWIHKYNGKYYLSHSDNSGGGANNGDQLKYAVSDSPLGPWTDMGAYVYA
ncbi:family 43 glycosylhydrolase, partial [Bacteroidales bacterium OttesenSCG-928-I21]|nr:family 43 glycosylhydrolase [Bacteroidales bacterium OttesenSCG-928-I21]